MKFTDRIATAKGKVCCYGDEIAALKNGGISYAVFFGLLLALLMPVLIIEILILITLGIDAGINASGTPEVSNELRAEEVPTEFQHLIPLAKKWGLGDAEDREMLIKASSLAELVEFERNVAPKIQQIDAWLDRYSEKQLGNSATAGHFIFLGTAYEEVSTYLEEQRA